ncbi:amino acid permease [Aeromonas salmonicida]|nr:amino acid permease [Aeromonas salmonicida]
MIVAGPAAMWGVFLVAQMLVHLGIERGLDGKLDQLLGEGAEIFFRLDVFDQLSGQCFEFVLVHFLTHEDVL